VHRATVYSRIHRVEEITGVSLDDGESRLALHLSIKLARLTGLI
jgi:DNA-binding PucR family transcriptional regulator